MSQGLTATHFMLSKYPVQDDSKGSENWLMLESLEQASEGNLNEDYKSTKLDVCWAPSKR
jgi:hypothetical protein